MTPSTIATITTSRDAPIPPTTIPIIILENLPTFNSAFRFDKRLRSLETTFFEYRQTNPFVDDVSAIPGIVHQYMTQQMMEAVREARRREDDDQEGPFAGSDWGSKRRREGGEHASASTPSETATATESAGRSTTRSQSRQLFASESAFAEEPVQTTCQMEEPSHPPRRPPSSDHDWNKTLPAAQGDAQSWINELARQTAARSSFNELLDTPIDFSNFIMNWLSVATLTPELLAGLTYELMMGSCNSPTELEYHLEEVYKSTTDQLDWVNPEVNRESALDVYSKRRIIAVTELKIVEWHNYKHLDWISVRRDDDKIYKFKEGDFKRLRLQDIKDMLLLLRRVEDLQLGVESYQKRLNLTKPDTDGTLNDVRNALDDCLKGIRMQYLPTTIWRRGDKDRAAAMIQAIDKRLKTKRILKSLEKFVGGRL
nr:hypothetical protein [Tanacetum cinerariifolium]